MWSAGRLLERRGALWIEGHHAAVRSATRVAQAPFWFALLGQGAERMPIGEDGVVFTRTRVQTRVKTRKRSGVGQARARTPPR